MIGCPMLRWCAVACLFGDESQQPTWPQRHADAQVHPARRRCAGTPRSRARCGRTALMLVEVLAAARSARDAARPSGSVSTTSAAPRRPRSRRIPPSDSVPTRNSGAACANASAVPASNSSSPALHARCSDSASSMPRAAAQHRLDDDGEPALEVQLGQALPDRRRAVADRAPCGDRDNPGPACTPPPASLGGPSMRSAA